MVAAQRLTGLPPVIGPGCRILVTGCYAQRAPEEVAALPGVHWVVGNSHKHLAAQIATAQESVGFARETATTGFIPLAQLAGVRMAGQRLAGAEVVVGDIFAHTELLAAPVFDAANERTRPNLKVQDGCDNRCSFCVIPSVRGQSRSLPLERVLTEVRSLVNAGYREIVISGINLGRWGRDLPEGEAGPALPKSKSTSAGKSVRSTGVLRFEDLVRTILEETSLQKLRISSVEPMDWSDELIELMSTSSRIAKHAHVPLQSGSDVVLRRMHRKYRPWHYREKILKIRHAIPDASIGADVMVGFPGETEAEFAETRRMIEELPLTYLHVFTYSARPGTPAADHADQVPVAVARERNQILREIGSAKKAAFLRSQIGRAVDAITLRSAAEDYTETLTDNYLKMKIPGRFDPNRWLRAQVEGADGESLDGRLLRIAA